MSAPSSVPPSHSASKLVTGAAIAGVSTYVGFRSYRMLSAADVPQTFSKIKDCEENKGVDDGGKIRVSIQEAPLEEVCRTHLATFDGTLTTWALFKATAQRLKDNPFHGTLTADKQWKWETYDQVLKDAEQLGRGMERLGLLANAAHDRAAVGNSKQKPMRVFGLFGPNCSNWVKCEYAAVSRSATTVTLYATLTHEGIVHVLNLTGVETVACLSTSCALRCLDAKKDCPKLKSLVVAEKSEEMIKAAERIGVRIVTLDDLRQAGKEMLPENEPTEETIFTFCFTSGSTGLPKGALISHRAMVANVAASSASFQVIPVLQLGKERYLSFLPLAHQMERLVQAMMIAWGARIGFSRGDPALIMEDIALLRPTYFATVPRLLNRMYDGIRTKANALGGAKTKLFNLALQSKLHDLTHYHHLEHPLWDKLVFGKIRKQLGLDECRVVTTGSAPVAPRVLDFLRCVLSCRVHEGYGQTETTCTATMSYPLHMGGPEERISHVGGPIPTCEIKLRSVPEMEYLITDRLHDGRIAVIGRGEVLLRGPSLMNGYFNLPEKTAQTIDSEGWLHTGDIGAWLPEGTLCIIDRANNIFKTALGEYVQPEKIERAICRVPVIASAFVFGTTLNARLVAIVVLNMEALPHYCQTKGLDSNDMVALRNDLLAEVRRACQEASLMGFEVPAGIALQTKPFTIESGVLTATSKLVRGVAKHFFKNEIIDLYKEIGEEVKI